MVYAVASIPFGLVATWLLDTLGLRTGVSVYSFVSMYIGRDVCTFVYECMCVCMYACAHPYAHAFVFL